ncbi:MAG TPA: hypothetical protein PKW80_15505 [Bacteroidales bacterium]|nr:hypothetical protein [Bacteroidales bacterium]
MRNSAAFVFVIFLSGVLMYSCSVFDVSYSKKPEKIAEKFLRHFYKGEYEKAKKLGTSNTRQIIDLMEQLIAISGQNALPSETKLVMLDCNNKGDTSICNYFANDIKNELVLIKTDGKWLVDMKKETPDKSGKNNFLKQHEKHNEKNNKN